MSNERIARLRETLEQISKAGLDAADLAPAWATAALAADDQLAATLAPTCDHCDDTHVTASDQACPRCPIPCEACAANNGSGDFCKHTPCPCPCHKD